MDWSKIEIVDNNNKSHKGPEAKKFVEKNCQNAEIKTYKLGKIVVGKSKSANPKDVREYLEQQLRGKARIINILTSTRPIIINLPVAVGQVQNVINIIPPANALQMFLDENRDGVMDAIPAGQAAWTWGPAGQGAIILVNTRNHLNNQNVTARAEIVFRWLNNANDAVGAAWTAHLTVSHPPRVRLFTSRLKIAADANLLNIAAPVDLKSPLIQPLYSPADGSFSLWIEAAVFPSSAIEADWRVSLTFDFVDTNGAPSQQICELRIAPWIMASDLDPTATLFAVQNPHVNPPPVPSLQNSIQAFAAAAAVPINLRPPIFGMAGDMTKPFLRDVFKSGFVHAPHYQEIAVMRGLDHGSGWRTLGAIPPAGSIRPLFNGTQVLAEGNMGDHDQDNTSQDNGGNLLVTPPIANFPNGRILYGHAPGFACRMQNFFNHQQVQAPFYIDSSWLSVGHVDEYISFLPDAANVGGWQWKILLLSPRLGYAIAWLASARNNIAAGAIPQLFLDAEADALASFQANENFAQLSVRLANRGVLAPVVGLPAAAAGAYAADPAPPPGQNGKTVKWNNGNYQAQSLDAYLGDARHAAKYDTAQTAIDAARATIRARLGNLPEDRILEIPTLLDPTLAGIVTDNADSVNMLVLKDAQTRVLIPAPFGPVCADTYVFRRYIQEKVGPLVNAVTFANDWDEFHAHEGEIHCGTNQIPQPLVPARAWWLHPPAVAP